MRAKKAMYNNIAAALLQVTILVFGLILPRLFIAAYGSEMNGLVSTTKQMVSYLKYLELGITSALVFTLYKPLANGDYKEINPLVTRARKDYERISLIFVSGLLLLSLIYPLILKEDLDYLKVFFLVLLIGIYGALDFYTLAKYRVLLQADQKAYIVNLITVVTTVIQNVLTIILLLLGQPLLLVVAIPSIFLPLRSIFLNRYIKHKYKDIDYKTKPSKIKLKSRTHAFISGISTTINVSLPLVIVSLIVSLEMASVFGVYSMIFVGLAGILTVVATGAQSAFGNMFAKEETENIKKIYNYYELLFYILVTILFASALILIIPFVKVYTLDLADANIYIIPVVGILFTLWAIIYNAGRTSQAMINASGKWKKTTAINISEAFLLIALTTILGYFFSLTGILTAMIISTIYKTVAILVITNKTIVKTKVSKSLIRLLRIFIITFIVYIPFIFKPDLIDPKSFVEWFIQAVVIVAAATTITFIVNMIFDYKAMIGIYQRYIKRILFRNKLK